MVVTLCRRLGGHSGEGDELQENWLTWHSGLTKQGSNANANKTEGIMGSKSIE